MITRGLMLALVCALATPFPTEAQALRVVRTRNLRFRTVLSGFPTTVTRLNNRCGRVVIRGQRNAEILAQWTLPTAILHTTQGDPMPISFGVSPGAFSTIDPRPRMSSSPPGLPPSSIPLDPPPIPGPGSEPWPGTSCGRETGEIRDAATVNR